MVMMLCDEIKIDEINKLNDKYIFELKYDGVRAFIYIENHKISKIINRRGFDMLRQFSEFKELTFEFESGILDSEIIVENGKTCGDFNSGIALRTHLKDATEISERAEKLKAKILIFDIIELNKESLRFKRLQDRKIILLNNLLDSNLLNVVAYFDDYKQLWDMVIKEDLEGIIAKHRDSAYEDVRSKYWLKIKNWKETILEFTDYEKAESEKNAFYKGIILKNKEGVRCSCLGKKSDEVKKLIEENGSVKVVVQYLEKAEGFRFITFKELANKKQLSLMDIGCRKCHLETHNKEKSVEDLKTTTNERGVK